MDAHRARGRHGCRQQAAADERRPDTEGTHRTSRVPGDHSATVDVTTGVNVQCSMLNAENMNVWTFNIQHFAFRLAFSAACYGMRSNARP
jgi:hypothetical protein